MAAAFLTLARIVGPFNSWDILWIEHSNFSNG